MFRPTTAASLSLVSSRPFALPDASQADQVSDAGSPRSDVQSLRDFRSSVSHRQGSYHQLAPTSFKVSIEDDTYRI